MRKGSSAGARLLPIPRSIATSPAGIELRLGEIAGAERICNAGIAAIMSRLATMQWRNDDVRETIRLGL